MKEKEDLLYEIIKYCSENNISNSQNNPYKDLLVSFSIERKPNICEKCKQKIEGKK